MGLFWYLNVLLCVIFLFWFGSVFWIGFHNLDSGQNFRFLECSQDISLSDELVFGGVISPVDAYLEGVGQVFQGVVGLVLGCFFLGYSLACWLHLVDSD